ncbi:acetoin dehydrogenase dihydrolipoyllysine-residue acetyltransferase subunit [Phyllobacterium sp. YR531]|uniref:acetoin dehydrogenase dihydrolipoyllysine-residue acetyltransferase subunit n=1 Tax=Phyllobacterium sp. YR531 TaxID=1144343 RepID=UPI00026FC37D|nr:acetoin dehydrogenase dihydrolipoyllysine-residue acetyltransferase subunit [Phyllobacterium sp. YR531]EJN04303.1 pyruvate/2-oxoglutarate dehydrogenase complex, dihydrolipoamide acyltransferase component [Phyllobacterium sp. YR531]
MPVEVILPKVDMDMESGQISRWYAKEGEAITKGQLLFEIETDKAAMEIDAPSSGILRQVTAQEGATVPVGQAVAWIYAEGESYEASASVEVQAEVSSKKLETSVQAVTPEPEAVSDRSEGIRATPLARRLAREAGVDLATVKGSGPKGRIQKQDIEVETRAQTGAAKPLVTAKGDAPLNAVWLREGKGKALAPVVLLHGFGADLNSWRPMLGGGSIDNPVLAIDLPGHGESTLSIPESLEAIASQIEQTIVRYHVGPVILVGHSFGGAIAAEVAGRGNLDAQALVLIAPAGLGPEINGAFLSGFVRARSEPSLLAWMKQLVEDESLLTKPFVAATLQQSQNNALREAQRLISDRFFADGTQVFSIRQTLNRLSIPVRVIFGAADRVIPASHANGLPGEIALHLFAQSGHMPQLERREAVMRILKEVSQLVK